MFDIVRRRFEPSLPGARQRGSSARRKGDIPERPHLADRSAIEGQLRCCSIRRLLSSAEISEPAGAGRP